ncbi:MAG: Glu-tRNA(Gln) amidotransferase subunit GatD [Nanoarchaeota archaeon]|nr:Glu-tRNA(Gln) amidotransferase subunit GatD [Nanoarchaeota archaeon]
MKINLGDLIEIQTDKTFNGTYLPSKKGETTIKLSSGYNTTFNNKKIIKTKLIKEYKPKKEKTKLIKTKNNLPLISILHVGGTISSKVDYETGAVSPKFSAEELLSLFPEINSLANIKSKQISNIFSENIRFKHYNLIAKEIQKEINTKTSAIIITHGTDTLAYTSAALSFMLEDLSIPVILVGSQRSSDRPSSDNYLNLISAIKFVTKTDFADVAICMHASMDDKSCNILPALKTKKLHSTRRDAFKSINTKPIAIVKDNSVQFLTDHKKRNNNKLKLRLFKEKIKVGILKAHPNIFSSEILQYKNYDGLIIEATGLGHLPIDDDIENKNFFKALKSLKIPIVITTQTVFGNINLNIYSTGRNIKEYIINNYTDILTETAFIKLAFLLSNYEKKYIKELFNKNLRGEFSSRILAEEKFI